MSAGNKRVTFNLEQQEMLSRAEVEFAKVPEPTKQM